MIFLLLPFHFFLIGLTAFGGEYALLAFLQSLLVDNREWLTPEQFADLVALSQVCPGATGLNAALWSGYAAASGQWGFWPAVGGATLAAVGLSLPSFIFTAAVTRLKKNKLAAYVLETVLSLLRMLLPGIIAAAALMLLNEGNFGLPGVNPWQFGVSVFLFVATLVGTVVYKFNAIFMTLLCGVAGWLLL